MLGTCANLEFNILFLTMSSPFRFLSSLKFFIRWNCAQNVEPWSFYMKQDILECGHQKYFLVPINLLFVLISILDAIFHCWNDLYELSKSRYWWLFFNLFPFSIDYAVMFPGTRIGSRISLGICGKWEMRYIPVFFQNFVWLQWWCLEEEPFSSRLHELSSKPFGSSA